MLRVKLGRKPGGLEACTKLLDASPAPTAMAFVLVQHFDPTHPSLLVELLVEHTAMAVLQAENDMTILPEHFYVIPPGAYLSITGDTLRLSTPKTRCRFRLPFDFLLSSLAAENGNHAICVVLSRNGADGTVGLRAIRGAGGHVILRIRGGWRRGMPSSAITTGLVNRVVRVADIASALSSREGAIRKAARCQYLDVAIPAVALNSLLRAELGPDELESYF